MSEGAVIRCVHYLKISVTPAWCKYCHMIQQRQTLYHLWLNAFPQVVLVRILNSFLKHIDPGTLCLKYDRVIIMCTVQTSNCCTSRPAVCQCVVVQTTMDNMSKNKPSTSMTHVAFESKLRSVVRSSIHPCIRNCAAIRGAVVYYVRAAHAFSAGIKGRHCSSSIALTPVLQYAWLTNLFFNFKLHTCATGFLFP